MNTDNTNRRFTITICDEQPHRTFASPFTNLKIDDDLIEVDEIVVSSGVSVKSKVPFVFDGYCGVDSIVGIVENIRAVDGTVVGDLQLLSKNSDLADRIGTISISPGYAYDNWDLVGLDKDVPILVASEWTLHEVRGVAV